MNRRSLLAGLPWSAAWMRSGPPPPPPYGATPSRRQLQWHSLEFYGFLHFTINTFTDNEWGYGDESPSLFQPSAFDAAQIIGALKAAGMRGVILTCKHHDGFCLWPTKTTQHSIAASRWRSGKGDVVREISSEARKQGLRFGVYLSPWDRNTPHYGKPEYVSMYREQLRELLMDYGPVFEVWHDGANGGDGYYGGAREKRTIDKRTYYDWQRTWDLVRQLQPDAVIFSDVGPDIRWVGNEKGFAAETSWATYDPVAPDGGAPAPGFTRDKEGEQGHRNAKRWLPAECDVSIRPGWFWHESQNDRVKTPAQLFDLYTKSVGRGGSLLLNVPPDRRGLLHEHDVRSLETFGRMLRETFRRNLAAGAKALEAKTRAAKAEARRMLDGDRDTYWAGKVGEEVTFDLGRETSFDLIRVRECIPFGQRVDRFAVDQWKHGEWKTLAESTSIGNCRIIRLPEAARTNRVRLRILGAGAPALISEFALFRVSDRG
ncbi:MAG: alpha-L-fucosidase [Bryobacterales bacterium]|nr:alpha-L-fucosidase [Bryobacterales bacterium]